MLNKIKIPTNINIKFVIVNKQKILILEIKDKKSYIKIPENIKCSKDLFYLYFKSCSIKNFNHISFLNQIESCFKNLNKPFCKKLILKGLGLKANILTNSNILELKLGYSHTFLINIPFSIEISINKNLLSIEGLNKVTVGNLAYNIRKLKLPNVYKGRGIWYKNEIKVLKAIKKT